jgi:hypothetical protein
VKRDKGVLKERTRERNGLEKGSWKDVLKEERGTGGVLE